jgi:hypothetical protein
LHGPVLTGVTSAGTVGTVLSSRLVAITGCQAMGQVGAVGFFYWSIIDDGQNPNWQIIANAQTPGWTDINNTQTPNWVNVPMTV